MDNYFVNRNAQPNGDHEVHTSSCVHLPAPAHRIDLGVHLRCATAVAAAKQIYPRANGCFYCARPCHTQ